MTPNYHMLSLLNLSMLYQSLEQDEKARNFYGKTTEQLEVYLLQNPNDNLIYLICFCQHNLALLEEKSNNHSTL